MVRYGVRHVLLYVPRDKYLFRRARAQCIGRNGPVAKPGNERRAVKPAHHCAKFLCHGFGNGGCQLRPAVVEFRRVYRNV